MTRPRDRVDGTPETATSTDATHWHIDLLGVTKMVDIDTDTLEPLCQAINAEAGQLKLSQWKKLLTQRAIQLNLDINSGTIQEGGIEEKNAVILAMAQSMPSKDRFGAIKDVTSDLAGRDAISLVETLTQQMSADNKVAFIKSIVAKMTPTAKSATVTRLIDSMSDEEFAALVAKRGLQKGGN